MPDYRNVDQTVKYSKLDIQNLILQTSLIGAVLLLCSFLYFLYYPLKENDPLFFPLFGFTAFIISQLAFLIAAGLSRIDQSPGKGVLIGITLFVAGIGYQVSLLIAPLLAALRPDVTFKGFIPPVFVIAGIPLQYINLIFVIAIVAIIINFQWFIEIINQATQQTPNNPSSQQNSYFSIFRNFIIILFERIRNIVYLPYKERLSPEIIVAIIIGGFSVNILSLIIIIPGILGIYVPFIFVLIISGVISGVLTVIFMIWAISNRKFNIDPEKLNVRRDSLLSGLGAIILMLILQDLLFFTFFFPIIPENEVFYWILRDIISDSLFIGVIYLQVALGITIVYKILKFANFAQAEYVTFGAYMAMLFSFLAEESGFWIGFDVLTPVFRWIPVILILCGVAFIFSVIAGIIFDKLIFKPMRVRNASPASLMIASFGIGLAFREIMRSVFSNNVVPIGDYFFAIQLDSFIVRIFIITLALLITWFFQLILYRSKLGKMMRAVSDNPDLAEVSGIEPERVHILVWVIAAGFAGVAGVLFASYPVGAEWIRPNMGFLLLLPAFAVTVLGGIGSFEGVLLASFIIGFAESFGSKFLEQIKDVGITVDIPVLVFNSRNPFIDYLLAIILIGFIAVVSLAIYYKFEDLWSILSEKIGIKLPPFNPRWKLRGVIGFIALIAIVIFIFHPLIPGIAVGYIIAEPQLGIGYKLALSFAVLIVVLLIRPYGLLGEKPSGDR
ncbi:MAG: branched-chain amino acid ABC transporter permease [Candidatus Hermodarchaeota archaeon]